MVIEMKAKLDLAENNDLSNGTVRLLRIISLILGVILIVLAILANGLGLSISGGLSRNQVCIGIAGLVLVTAGVMGRKFPGLYRGIALFILNLAVLIMVVEFLALVLLKVLDAPNLENRMRKMEETGGTAPAEIINQGRYAPYVIWRANPEIAGEGLWGANSETGQCGRLFVINP